MKTPTVSIILPTYNRADTLSRAIDSVVAQWFDDWELIVIDDGSQDETVALVEQRRDPRIRLVSQENAGVYVARNRGLAEARGRLITFLDSDDAWRPHFLSLTTAFLDSAQDQSVVTTEFHQDFGAHVERHDHHLISSPYLRFAGKIGSNSLVLPEGETDDYLVCTNDATRWVRGDGTSSSASVSPRRVGTAATSSGTCVGAT